MAGAQRTEACACLCKRFCILTLPSENILVLILMTDNCEMFPSNLEVHKVNTRYRHAFYRSTANFKVFYKGVLYEGIKPCKLLMGIQSLSIAR
jgi:hypothetical protein